MSTFPVALIQMRSGMSLVQNVEAFAAAVEEAAKAGARNIQSPEMTGLVTRGRDALLSEIVAEEDDPVVAVGRRLASAHDVTVHIGSTPVLTAPGRVANRAILIGPDGDIRARYDKLHLFDVDLANGESWRESATYDAGQGAVVSDIGAARLGLSICYDLRFPELYAQMALAGAEMLAIPAAFTRQTGEAHWHVLQRARAIETGSFVLSAAQGGRHEDGRETFGHSIIIDPWGRVVAEKPDSEPGILYGELDFERVAEARRRIPNLKHRKPISVEVSG